MRVTSKEYGIHSSFVKMSQVFSKDKVEPQCRNNSWAHKWCMVLQGSAQNMTIKMTGVCLCNTPRTFANLSPHV